MTRPATQKRTGGRSESAARPGVAELVRLRSEWRRFHEKQDRESAEAVFRQASVDGVSDLDLKTLPALFRQKLNKFGRDWERALAAQAVREGYSFYRAQMEISVEDVGALQTAIDSRLSQPLEGR